VLDIGTGQMDSLRRVACRVKIGLDAHRPYLENRHIRDAVPLNADARAVRDLFLPGSVDLVTMIDVIEHLPKPEAQQLLADAETIAARCTVITTPRGWFPQAAVDASGLGGEELQVHQSAWEVDDFTRSGYRVAILRDFHGPENLSFVRAFGREAPPIDALVAWKDASPDQGRIGR
jgi:2-polyprenyl-3-methyl-5-hydroxy-6-metoxy-1,4-benzoquinol methylase